MTKLRIAVVGVGTRETSRARGYLSTIKRLHDRWEICALCDSGDALDEMGERFGVSARFRRYADMLDQSEPDVVFLLVPSDGQTPLALEAIDRGCHVLTEIPYALTLPMGDAVAEAAREKGVQWEIAENVWRWPNEQLKRRIVEQGLLGKITHARMFYTHGSYHGFNGIRKLLGRRAKRVLGYAQCVDIPEQETYGGDRENTRWWDSAVIEFEDDITCLYEMPPSPSPRHILWEVEGTSGHLSGRTLVLYDGSERATHEIEEVYEDVNGEQVLSAVRVDTDPPVVWENPYKSNGIGVTDDTAKACILDSLHRAITEGEPLAYGSDEARQDMELWVAVRESAENGNRWVNLPIRQEVDVERRIRAEYVRRYGGDPVEDYGKLLDGEYNRLSAMWTVAGFL